MQFQVDAGKIKDVEVYSDALNIELAEAIPKFLKESNTEKKPCVCSLDYSGRRMRMSKI